jgi:hypothetical protein
MLSKGNVQIQKTDKMAKIFVHRRNRSSYWDKGEASSVGTVALTCAAKNDFADHISRKGVMSPLFREASALRDRILPVVLQ